MTRPAFTPKPGQVDFTGLRYAPVVNTVATYKGKILLAQRSHELRHYPGWWNGISGYLDDHLDIAAKVYEELREEVGLHAHHVKSIRIERPLIQEAPEYGKTWLVIPVLAIVTTDKITLNWEAADAGWFTPAEARKLQLLDGCADVLAHFFP
jgi:NADH pyrophosphatase NudC (nudix superfamily)